MKGSVVTCIMNEKNNEEKKWNEIWYGENRWKLELGIDLCSEVDVV